MDSLEHHSVLENVHGIVLIPDVNFVNLVTVLLNGNFVEDRAVFLGL